MKPSCRAVVSVGALVVTLFVQLAGCLRSPDTPRERSRAREDRLLRERYGREQARKVIVTTVLVEPYMMLKPNSFLVGNDRFEGFIADILERLARAGRFPYQIRLASDGQVGSRGENGNWTGIIGEVKRGEADIGAGPLAATRLHQSAVAFSRPFLRVRTTALIRKPPAASPSPASPGVAESRRWTAPSSPGLIHSPEELLDSRLLYGAVVGGGPQALFRRLPQLLYRRMWARMANFWPPAFVSSVAAGIQRARRQPYAFVVDSPMADFHATRRPCDLYRTDQFHPTRGYAFALRHGDETDRGARLMTAINAELTRLEESDELRALYDRWWRSECPADVTRGDVSGDALPAHAADVTLPSPWRSATASDYSVLRSAAGAAQRPLAPLCVLSVCAACWLRCADVITFV